MRLNEGGARLSKPALDLRIRHPGEPYCRQPPRHDAESAVRPRYVSAEG